MTLREARLFVVSCGVAAAAAALTMPGRAQAGPFSALDGDWTGNGTIAATNGSNERIRCRANYNVSPEGRSLEQQLRCASDSYHFNVNSSLVYNGGGYLGGTWTETTRNATGNVSGQVRGDDIVAQVSGPSFTAQLTVKIRGAEQSVAIVPSGGDIASVQVDMRRDK